MLVHGKPLTVAGADVDVDWAEVVVLLVSWKSTQADISASLPHAWNQSSAPALRLRPTDLACGCRAPSCKAGPCSCPVWCGPRGWACCCWTPPAWKMAALAAPAAGASIWSSKEWRNVKQQGWLVSFPAGDRSENKTSPFRVGEVDVGPKLNNLSHWFLLWAGERDNVGGE